MEAHMNPSRIALIVGGLLIAGATGIVTAMSFGGGQFVARTFAAAVPLPDAEIQSRLQAQGFSNLQNLQHKGNRVIVTATKDGQTAQVAVSPTTGEVIRDGDGDDNDNDD
jgi:hypothetical protein